MEETTPLGSDRRTPTVEENRAEAQRLLDTDFLNHFPQEVREELEKRLRWEAMSEAERFAETAKGWPGMRGPRELYELYPALFWACNGTFRNLLGHTFRNHFSCLDIGFKFENYALDYQLNAYFLTPGYMPHGDSRGYYVGSELVGEELNALALARMIQIDRLNLNDFLEQHCNWYSELHPESGFVENLKELIEEHGSVALTTTRKGIITDWINKRQPATIPSVEEPAKRNKSRAIHRPLAISLYYRQRSGNFPAFDAGKIKSTLKDFAEKHGIAPQNFYVAFNEISHEKDRFRDKGHFKVAIDILNDYPEAQKLARSELENSGKKK